MSPLPPDDRARALLQEGAALRALARCLVRADDVDDVLQDTQLAALAAPRTIDAFLPAWLRATARNVARMAQRGERRRAARERLAAATRAAATEPQLDPAALAQQAELVRDLGAAVYALDEPFRTAVLLRFWHGLAPDAIAARTGVPRNTVRSRLQRGLERLRAALDARHGRDDWRASLALLAAPPALRSATTAALAGAGWIMHTKTIGAAAAAVVLTFAGLWAWRGDAPEPAVARDDVPAAAAVQSAAAAHEPAASPAPRVLAMPAAAAPTPANPLLPSPDHVALHGRCVDERGDGLADVHVEAVAQVHLLLPPDEARVATRSGADGGFVLTLLPSTPSYVVNVHADGRAASTLTWPDLEPGRTYDVGDLTLGRGGGAAGRVVDSAGQPQANVSLRLLPRGLAGAPRELAPAAVDLRTAADGTFQTSAPLTPGPWLALLLAPHADAGARKARHEFDVAASATTTGIELIVEASVARLRARVVDERGIGVAGAAVSRGSAVLTVPLLTDEDGWFELPRHAADTAPTLELQVRALGREVVRTGPIPWDHAEPIVLPRAARAIVDVRTRADERPVERFGLRLVPTLDTPGSVQGRAVIALPRVARPNGRVELDGLAVGRYLVWVDSGVDGVPSFLGEVRVAGAAPRCTLHAPVLGTRRARVHDAAGRPLAGSVVELVQTHDGGPIAPGTLALPPRELDPSAPLLVQRLTTDAAGEVVLAAAGATPFGVRALGPGHRPTAVQSVLLDDALGVLAIRVDVEGTVLGTVGPADVLARFGPSPDVVRATASLGERGAAMFASHRPHVLLRAVGGTGEHPAKAADGAVRDDGTFRIDGVPPGSWHVVLRCRLPDLGGAQWSAQLETPLATVADVQPGAPRRVVLDAGALRFGTLRARVLVDGAPFAHGTVDLLCRRPDLAVGSSPLAEASVRVALDGDGALALDVPPGEYTIEAHVPSVRGPTSAAPARLRNDQSVHLAPGAAADATFALLRRTLRVRVLQADGSPAAGRRFSVLQPGRLASAGTTDAHGWLELESVPAGSFHLATWPLALSDQAAQTAHIRAHPYPQWLDALVRLGPLQMNAGEVRAETELRLPD